MATKPKTPARPADAIRLELANALGEPLLSLAIRWSNEHEYEDFADYVAALAQHLPEGARLIHLSKRFVAQVAHKAAPGFVFAVMINGEDGTITCQGRSAFGGA